MNLLLQSQKHIRDYVAGLISASDLQDWLGDASPVATDPETAKLVGDAWRLLSEYGYGHRDESSARAELARIVGTSAASLRVEWNFNTATLTATLSNMVPANVIRTYEPVIAAKSNWQGHATASPAVA